VKTIGPMIVAHITTTATAVTATTDLQGVARRPTILAASVTDTAIALPVKDLVRFTAKVAAPSNTPTPLK
jgi:hypothetical protein